MLRVPGEGTREEAQPISPAPDSSVPHIFSSKKIFFLSSPFSVSRRSEIPHIETDYLPRDQVSRRLFNDHDEFCDCASEGCGGSLKRNKRCFFKFFVLILSIVVVVLLFASLSYNLARERDTVDDSFELGQNPEWVSHEHYYNLSKKSKLFGELDIQKPPHTPYDSPVPMFETSDDYDAHDDYRHHYSIVEANHGKIVPLSYSPLDAERDTPLIIVDAREPYRFKRSIDSKNKKSESDLVDSEPNKKNNNQRVPSKRKSDVESIERFRERLYKNPHTVFQPFSLTPPSYSESVESFEYSIEDNDIEEELKFRFLTQTEKEEETTSATVPQTESTSLTTETQKYDLMARYLKHNLLSELIGFTGYRKSDEQSKEDKDEKFYQSLMTENPQVTFTYSTENEVFDETTKRSEDTREKMDDKANFPQEGEEYRTFSNIPLIQVALPLAVKPLLHLLGSNPVSDTSSQSQPDKVTGISLAEAKELKKERRKQLLLNSRVVGGSSDVRLPTAPDISRPFINAFESLKTNQQLSFTPSAASQYVLPYQMCFFASPIQGLKQPSVHNVQPRTFSFRPPLFPPILDNTPGKQQSNFPSQQNFLSFSINNYANPPASRPGPSGSSVFNFPAPQPYPTWGNRQPIFCTYLQPPLFQFPTVPGSADYSHAKCEDCENERKVEVSGRGRIFSPVRDTICSTNSILCRDGSNCIPINNWCDNEVHCRDASDEAFCSCRERVTKDKICDGYVDCPQGEDELGCFDCPKTAFSCDSVISPESCIPLNKRCDGYRDCSSGADEADCSALFFHMRQNDSYHVSQTTGFLHHNWKGDWFPVCVEVGENVWANEACTSELGFLAQNVDTTFAPVPDHYRGPFIVRQEDGSSVLQDHCKGHVSTYVKCPTMRCGTRVEFPTFQEFENRFRRFIQNEVRVGDVPFITWWQNFKKNETKGHKVIRVEGNIPEDVSEEMKRLKREETGRVVGGRESQPRAWPWAIALYKDGAFHCGGVVLDDKWVLTAAHCVEQYWKHFYEVRAGMLRRYSFSAMEQVREVTHVIVHEKYDPSIMSNDIAVLRLDKPFHFNRWVRPACLPSLLDGASKFHWGPVPGSTCIAVGWGALRERGADPDQLREVEIPIMSRCKHKEDLAGAEICAGKLEGGKDTCQGDSGGPLLCRDSSTPSSWYVAGIVSHGEGCARPGEPGAYTRISLFVDWITANTNDFQLPTVKPVQNCPGFRCRSGSKLCIPSKWVCNGFTDCLEAEDEKNCGTNFMFSNLFDEPFAHRFKNAEKNERNLSSVDETDKKIPSTNVVLETTTDENRDGWVTLFKQINYRTRTTKIYKADELTKKESSTTENIRIYEPDLTTNQHTSTQIDTSTNAPKFKTDYEKITKHNKEQTHTTTTETLSETSETLSSATEEKPTEKQSALKTLTSENLINDLELPTTTYKNDFQYDTVKTEEHRVTQKETEITEKFSEEIKENEVTNTTEESLESTTEGKLISLSEEEVTVTETEEQAELSEDSTEKFLTEMEETTNSVTSETALSEEKTPDESTLRKSSSEHFATEKLTSLDLTDPISVELKTSEDNSEDYSKTLTTRELVFTEKSTTTLKDVKGTDKEKDSEEDSSSLSKNSMEVPFTPQTNQNSEEIMPSTTVEELPETTERDVLVIEIAEPFATEANRHFTVTEKPTRMEETSVERTLEDSDLVMTKEENEKTTEVQFLTRNSEETTEAQELTKDLGEAVEVQKLQGDSEETTEIQKLTKDSDEKIGVQGLKIDSEETPEVQELTTDPEEILEVKQLAKDSKEIASTSVSLESKESYEDVSKEVRTTESQKSENENWMIANELEPTEPEYEILKESEEISENIDKSITESVTKKVGKLLNADQAELTKTTVEDKNWIDYDTPSIFDQEEEVQALERPEEESSENEVETTEVEDSTTVTLSPHFIQTRETLKAETEDISSTSSYTEDITTNELPQKTGRKSFGRKSDGTNYFQCTKIVQSIVKQYRCDGFIDCEDGSDEEDCTCAEGLQYSDPKLLCDGKVDCSDQSDEKNCSKCSDNEFYCKKSDECVDLHERCDGEYNCRFGEDEEKCFALAKDTKKFLQPNGQPFLNTKGVMISNKNGVWSVECQEGGRAFGGRQAIQVCSSLGTIGYEMYENKTLTKDCTGFEVTCMESLASSINNYGSQESGFMWPWNAFVYSDGVRVCSAVLLHPRWLLTTSRCMGNVNLERNYLSVKLGSKSPSPKTIETGSEIVRIDAIRNISDSDFSLLHLAKEVNQTQFIRPLGLQHIFNSNPEKDVCVAVSDRTVFLRISNRCNGTAWCFKNIEPVSVHCRSKPWKGIVVCQSTLGWYPASTYSEHLGHCGFKSIKFVNIKDKVSHIRQAMGKRVEVSPEPFCSGFRCHEGFCIPKQKVCDGWPDCSSKNDEDFEMCKGQAEARDCEIDELRCSDGQCLPKVVFKDGIKDCRDNSDEPKNTTCLEYLRLTSPQRICDGRRNCYDKTDEDVNMCSCDEFKFECKSSGKCIPKDFMCDGEKDCPDGEDELHCVGHKNVKAFRRSHVEVMRNSFGVWHTICAPAMSKQKADHLCRDLGFKQSLYTFERNQTVYEPHVDSFSWVKLNPKSSIALRGDKPFVRLVKLKKTCTSVKCA